MNRTAAAITPPATLTKDEYHRYYVQWCEHNTKGGYVIDEVVAAGNHVGVAVQFFTVARPGGQQKMTEEIHIIELDAHHRVRRGYFYEDDRCGSPDSPCSW